VAVQTKVGRKTISNRRARLRRDCTYRLRIIFKRRSRLGRAGRLRFKAGFLGNDALRPVSAKRRSARVGR
jgi:hypothetical protein